MFTALTDMYTTCPWPKSFAEQHYHDQEWGRPITADHLLFEQLILESAQAGLSWSTILNKRQAYREAFHNFQIDQVANMNEQDVQHLMQHSHIVRHKGKIRATIANARMVQIVQAQYGSFAQFIWEFVNGKPIQHNFHSPQAIPIHNEISKTMSNTMKQLGGQFIGPTICYAYMQAIGIVNDHLIGCAQHAICLELGQTFAL